MDRNSFIRVLEGCISSATGRDYKHIDWAKMSDQGLVECGSEVDPILWTKMGGS